MIHSFSFSYICTAQHKLHFFFGYSLISIQLTDKQMYFDTVTLQFDSTDHTAVAPWESILITALSVGAISCVMCAINRIHLHLPKHTISFYNKQFLGTFQCIQQFSFFQLTFPLFTPPALGPS